MLFPAPVKQLRKYTLQQDLTHIIFASLTKDWHHRGDLTATSICQTRHEVRGVLCTVIVGYSRTQMLSGTTEGSEVQGSRERR